MKEDYLWDKTGNDIEIEKLENALSQFRYKETVAPVIIPEKVFAVEKTPKRKLFSLSFAFAFASCIAFVLILFGVWFQGANKNIETGNDLAQSITPEIKIDLSSKQIETFDPVKKIETPQTADKTKFTNAKNSSSAKKFVPQKTKFVRQKNKVPKTETVKLTEEEKYAYSQLMLALSITSSQLKLVREKIDSIEKPQIVLKKDDNTRRN